MFRPVMMSAEKYGRTYDILTLEVSPCLSEEPWLKRAVEAFKRELPPVDAVVQRFHEKSEPEVVDREQGIVRTHVPIPWLEYPEAVGGRDPRYLPWDEE